MNPDAHYHVIAVKDRGGTQERWIGWDDHFTPAQASNHVNNMKRAESLSPQDGMTKFGEGYHDLLGWDRVWIVECGPPCGFDSRNPKAACPEAI